MIGTQYPTDAFEDAIEATAYMATALLSRGELLLPPRIREHIADGKVVVHLIRGEDDVARCEATLTSESKLSGIDWPADVKPRTSLLVLCPRGGASHDIGVVLPELERPVSFDDDADVNAVLDEIEDEAPVMVHGRPDAWTAEEASIGEQPVEPDPVTDEQLAAITGALTALADAAPVIEVARPGPAEYEVPTTLRPADAPTETIAAVPADGWPAAEPDDAATPITLNITGAEPFDTDFLVKHLAVFEEEPAEQTAIVPAVGVIEWPTYDYRPRWRRALAWVRTNTTPTRAVYAAATGGTFLGSLLTWLVAK